MLAEQLAHGTAFERRHFAMARLCGAGDNTPVNLIVLMWLGTSGATYTLTHCLPGEPFGFRRAATQ